MSDILPTRIPLAGTKGDAFFVRQQDDYSCGPASLATVAKIFGVDISYDDMRAIVKPDPQKGTTQAKIAEVAGKLLPFETEGENTYKGGVAVANIMQEGEGHYVVFLAREGDTVIYYEPFWHELVVADIKTLDWHTEDDRADKWSAGFTPVEGNSIAKWRAYADKKPAAAPKPPKP
jgi:hypothetical protein